MEEVAAQETTGAATVVNINDKTVVPMFMLLEMVHQHSIGRAERTHDSRLVHESSRHYPGRFAMIVAPIPTRYRIRIMISTRTTTSHLYMQTV